MTERWKSSQSSRVDSDQLDQVQAKGKNLVKQAESAAVTSIRYSGQGRSIVKQAELATVRKRTRQDITGYSERIYVEVTTAKCN